MKSFLSWYFCNGGLPSSFCPCEDVTSTGLKGKKGTAWGMALPKGSGFQLQETNAGVILRIKHQTEVGILCLPWPCSWSSRSLSMYQYESKYTPNIKQWPTWQAWWEMNQGLPWSFGGEKWGVCHWWFLKKIGVEEAPYAERQENNSSHRRDPSDKSCLYKDQFQFLLHTYIYMHMEPMKNSQKTCHFKNTY